MNNNKIKIISFFTGGGFLDMGFEEAGFEISWTNEIDEKFIELYECGLKGYRETGHEDKYQKDVSISDSRSIEKINKDEILQKAFNNKPPAIFGVIGGPPCQDFSLRGKREGFKGDRGKLTEEFFEKIIDLKPAFFLMENVVGIIQGGNKGYLKQRMKPIREKYTVDYNILNSINYGVPQDRKRVFFVGFAKDRFPELDSFPWPERKYVDAIKEFPWPKSNTFKQTPIKPPEIPDELCVSECLIDVRNNGIANSKEFFNSFSEKFNTVNEGDTKSHSFKRLHRYRYSPTACYGNNEVHLHPFLPRRLSVREALRIQGVPDAYILPEYINNNKLHYGLSAKFKMIGNGVPVPLSKAVAESIKIYLESYI